MANNQFLTFYSFLHPPEIRVYTTLFTSFLIQVIIQDCITSFYSFVDNILFVINDIRLHQQQMTRLVIANKHQKVMCKDEIELFSQIMDTNLYPMHT